ncbi:MAG TPA: polysialyltransferase family glycosyltransferase [Kiritimatiellia bacterium]|nr:polysialyltransferase family glycosyltransferase [Kiritimatiellia bacterium]HRZ11493.1 polysialyltransferase family glycosyltransferase [Kiritimatiellia bacterium]HSA16956.1 polysialyltransferase family glycosyltransferase [Kiritimatiellia bacterium]
MKRLVFAPGLGQLVNAAAALTQDRVRDRGSTEEHEDVLVFFANGRYTDLARAMQEAARCLWSWRAIEWAEDVLVSHFPTRRFAPIARDVLRERLGADPDEIWVSKLGLEATKLILYAFPGARVVLFEDGAEEFIPQEVLCGRARLKQLKPAGWPGGLRREWSHWGRTSECLGMEGLCVRDRARVVRMYSYLARQVELPAYLSGVPVVHVESESLRGRLQALAPLFDPAQCRQPPKRPGESAVLFLPQPFADIFLTAENEYALYRAAVSEILDKGYSILWKEHPREITPLAPRLKQDLAGDRLQILRVRQQIPVECLVAGWDLAAVVSVSSTSLLLLGGLYGYPAFTAADRISIDCWRKRSDSELARLFLRTLPGLDQLPAARAQE